MFDPSSLSLTPTPNPSASSECPISKTCDIYAFFPDVAPPPYPGAQHLLLRVTAMVSSG